jgi:hypothetical protein
MANNYIVKDAGSANVTFKATDVGANGILTTNHIVDSLAIANAAAPSKTEGAAVLLSTDLHGSQRTTLLDSNGLAVDFSSDVYKNVAASATNTVLGSTGAVGDTLDGILVIPATIAAGAVSIKDGTNSATTVYVGGGTTALNSLIPFFIPLGIKSAVGAWQVSTGANVAAMAVGKFT